MSYTIGNVIYGFPVDPKIFKLHEDDDGTDIKAAAEEAGLTRLYSASGDDPWYCGLELCRFNAVEPAPFKLDELMKKAEKALDGKIKLVVNDLIRQLPKKHQREPAIWVVWSSS